MHIYLGVSSTEPSRTYLRKTEEELYEICFKKFIFEFEVLFQNPLELITNYNISEQGGLELQWILDQNLK